MAPARIYVEVDILCGVEDVWMLTHDPEMLPRWDARFSSITPTGRLASGAHRFTYERSTPFHTFVGTVTALREPTELDGTRASALRFTTRDTFSALGAGHGYWRCIPFGSGVRLITAFDYEPGWGSALDALVVRRLIGWMTAWSFDRLRIWAETGVPPENWPWWSVLQVWRRDRPRASRCRRAPQYARGGIREPSTLAMLETP